MLLNVCVCVCVCVWEGRRWPHQAVVRRRQRQQARQENEREFIPTEAELEAKSEDDLRRLESILQVTAPVPRMCPSFSVAAAWGPLDVHVCCAARGGDEVIQPLCPDSLPPQQRGLQ